MQFGVPNQRRTSTKVEKYPNTPVVTTVISEERKTRSIYFNEKAAELLNLPEEDATIAFGFEGDQIFIVNSTGNMDIPEEHKIKVTKSLPRKISDKRTYEYIMKLLGLDDQRENDFVLTASVLSGQDMFMLNFTNDPNTFDKGETLETNAPVSLLDDAVVAVESESSETDTQFM